MPSGRTQVIHRHERDNNLGALVASTAILLAQIMDSSLEQGHKLKKLKGTMEMKSKTAGQGPILIGISSGLDAAEVAEAIVADPQLHKDAGDSDESNRKVFPIWVLPEASTSMGNVSAAILDHNKLENLRVPSWTTEEGRALNWFAHNLGSADLTSGTTIQLTWAIVIEWLRD